MTEREVRAQLAAYLDELDDRVGPPAPEEPGRLRKVLLPAALGASMLLTTACEEATPIALPYMGPMPDGYFWDYRVDPPDQGSEAAPDQGSTDAASDAKTDAPRDAGLDLRDGNVVDGQGE